MGIRPNTGENVETHYRVDGSTEAQQLINDAEHTGNEAGKVFAEVAAKADSANAGATELSKRVAALEKKVAAPPKTQQQAGAYTPINWRRWGNVVAVTAPSPVAVADLAREQAPSWAVPDQLEGTASVGSTTGTSVYMRGNGLFTVQGEDTTVRFTLTYIVL